MVRIDIARDFCRLPCGRRRTDGPASGEAFRDYHLAPALAAEHEVVVSLNRAGGYPACFLEEAFGGLVRMGYPADDIRARIRLVAEPAYRVYVALIWGYVAEAERARDA